MGQSGGNIQMVMFTGEYRHNLDPKNRLIIPSKY
ncbi:MAG: cell division/cell wall cluster transcriptional repressor MraZ, partial [Solobacterium sp.]|nr:cell division/cell wall cluster transcriptional repressor MraZ [Solobacterium sp.]